MENSKSNNSEGGRPKEIIMMNPKFFFFRHIIIVFEYINGFRKCDNLIFFGCNKFIIW